MSLLSTFLEEDAALFEGKEAYVAIRTDGAKGSGTFGDPYNGATPELLDPRLEGLPTDVTVRFGPGIFQTYGLITWAPKNGQRLIGTGIGTTTLQLVGVVPSSGGTRKAAIIYSQLSRESIEISDMTLDVNLARQDKVDPLGNWSNSKTQANAIELSGRNIRVRRVRVINWGTYTSAQDTDPQESFPIYIKTQPVGGNAVGDNIVEDCIIEQPDLSMAREATLLNNSYFPNAMMVHCAVRRNFICGDFTTGSLPPHTEVRKITAAGYVVTVITHLPHRLFDKDVVLISGSSVPEYNGRFCVTTSDGFCTFQFEITTLASPPTNSGIRVQRILLTRTMVPTKVTGAVCNAMMVANISVSGNTVTITTTLPHLRVYEDMVRISGVLVNGDAMNRYNGSFFVHQVINDFQFTYLVDTNPSDAPDTWRGVWLDRWSSLPVIIKNNGLTKHTDGTATVETVAPHYKAEGDYLIIIDVDGSNWSGYWKVVSLLDNKRVKISISGGTTTPNYTFVFIASNLQAMSATGGFCARAYHNRVAGVRVTGPYHDNGPGPTMDLATFRNYGYIVYVGQFSTVPDNSEARYNVEGSNFTHDNVYDLAFIPGLYLQPPPGGIAFFGPLEIGEQYFPTFQVLVIRDNHIRFVGGAQGEGSVGLGYNQIGISGRSCQDLIVEENFITFPQVILPLESFETVNYTFFNNTGFNATFLPGKNRIGSIYHFVEEIQTVAEDLVWAWR